MRKSQAERDQANLHRRLEVLRLPVVPLRHHGHLRPADRGEWDSEPTTVGVGPDGTAMAVWRHRRDEGRRQVTTHGEGGEALTAAEVRTDLTVSFVQPLPEDRFLLVAARVRPVSAPNAEIRNADGTLADTGSLGDAIEQVLTTPSGRVWVGYFDEALGGPGPQGHGLARFGPDLSPEWLYPHDAGLPAIVDCYTLNVRGEHAFLCPYADFPLLAVERDRVTNFGPAPCRGASGLLIEGRRAVLLAGYGPEYDLAMPIRLNRDGAPAAAAPFRLVLPDGMEIQRARHICRGADLHAFVRGSWYRSSLTEFGMQ